jgi:hypothetical protein
MYDVLMQRDTEYGMKYQTIDRKLEHLSHNKLINKTYTIHLSPEL